MELVKSCLDEWLEELPEWGEHYTEMYVKLRRYLVTGYLKTQDIDKWTPLITADLSKQMKLHMRISAVLSLVWILVIKKRNGNINNQENGIITNLLNHWLGFLNRTQMDRKHTKKVIKWIYLLEGISIKGMI